VSGAAHLVLLRDPLGCPLACPRHRTALCGLGQRSLAPGAARALPALARRRSKARIHGECGSWRSGALKAQGAAASGAAAAALSPSSSALSSSGSPALDNGGAGE